MKSIAPLLRKKWLLAVIAAAVVGSGAYAFAATLGVSSASLGAGNAAVVSCAASVNASYTASYDVTVTPSHYYVSTVSLTIPATAGTCVAGDVLSVQLEKNGTGSATNTGAAAGAGFNYTLQTGDFTSPPTGDLTKVITVTEGNLAGTTGAAGPTDGTPSFNSTKVPAGDLSGIAVAAVGKAVS